ncbi:MAG: hypothetical protein QNJ16_15700 [Rhodobacter sp.]|nr:hypothetical protein [Rhodobacter sp.]
MTIRRLAATLVCVFAGWLAVLSLVVAVSDAAPGAVAVWPSAGFLSRLPEGAAVVGAGPLWVTVRSDLPGLGRTLYRAGARLVLPAGLPGCLPLPAPPR